MGLGCIGCLIHPRFVEAAATPRYNKAMLLRRYDAGAERRRMLYSSLFNPDELEGILMEMRASYESVIPEMPYIGLTDFHLQWFIPNCEKLADYLVAKKFGVDMLQFSNLHLAQEERDLLERYTEEELVQIGSMQFGPVAELQMRLRAWRSQLRLYPEAHVFYFVKGDGEDFDWGLDYVQCANMIFYSRYNEQDLLLHLVCNADYVAGKVMRTGYHRTTELATGGTKCDLRWKKGVVSTMPG